MYVSFLVDIYYSFFRVEGYLVSIYCANIIPRQHLLLSFSFFFCCCLLSQHHRILFILIHTFVCYCFDIFTCLTVLFIVVFFSSIYFICLCDHYLSFFFYTVFSCMHVVMFCYCLVFICKTSVERNKKKKEVRNIGWRNKN